MRYFQTKRARIEIIPMIDIMLFLLVFFVMLTLRMLPSSGHVSKLPTSATATVIPTPKMLIEIQPNSHLVVDGREVTPTQLTTLVAQRNPAKLAVTIAGGADVSLQQVMNVIDAVRNGGATQVGLAARHR